MADANHFSQRAKPGTSIRREDSGRFVSCTTMRCYHEPSIDAVPTPAASAAASGGGSDERLVHHIFHLLSLLTIEFDNVGTRCSPLDRRFGLGLRW